MEVEYYEKKRSDVYWLHVEANVRYWEDGEVDGVQDIDGSLMPLRRSDCLIMKIHLDSGYVSGWPSGKTAKLHYKVCDAGVYTISSSENDPYHDMETTITKDGYVPSCLSIDEYGYGDYIILTIMEDGHIKNWNFNKHHLEYFTKVEDE